MELFSDSLQFTNDDGADADVGSEDVGGDSNSKGSDDYGKIFGASGTTDIRADVLYNGHAVLQGVDPSEAEVVQSALDWLIKQAEYHDWALSTDWYQDNELNFVTGTNEKIWLGRVGEAFKDLESTILVYDGAGDPCGEEFELVWSYCKVLAGWFGSVGC